ncbi:TetR/AcrR family transcriptional regulator [Croceibacterium mercuriale]|uniref:TetR/AcrR family transcriptional regulator n=1 Tax=Croceibacterium mercuriale TaxID=1572751 RepID=UPI00068E07FD|nr:TetR/AcrR family transcriptional regulator [Croceibacterium mercuriale]
MSDVEKQVPDQALTPRQQERRAAIVAAARQSFLAKGYAATSMSGLLKTLGGSKATLWSYFRSKEELFAAVIEDVTASFRQQIETDLLNPGDLEQTLVAFCRSFMARMTHPDGVATWRLVMAESSRFPEVGLIFYREAASQVERRLAGYLQQQIDAGRLRDEGALDMARLLMGMHKAGLHRRLWGVEPADGADADADARRFVGYFLRLFAVPG